ncbi:MAG: ribosome small subunit-dependent GTPase A [Bacilli bacterium]|jgi:ribosome biogenesis GTPase|nr:ribosome small subunit-dependent GTPase A [Bacilli bacterium]
MKTGRIIRIISNLYTVQIDEKIIECHARGKFRREKCIPCVGDYCEVDFENQYIMKILPRKNHLTRPRIANVDIALIVTSWKEPQFSYYLLDKLLTLVILNHIEPVLCFTKLDLMKKEEEKEWKKIKEEYEKIGISIFTNEEISRLKEKLTQKVVVVTGQTGAGKSTLLNRFAPNLKLKTNPISKALNRGVHTTRHTELFKIDSCYIADTPGFSALDLSEYHLAEIKNSFWEFGDISCKYRDCNHIKENECGVKEAVQTGQISTHRYESYRDLIKEVEK